MRTRIGYCFPVFESRVVMIAVVEDGRRLVGLLDPADDLVVEGLLKRLGMGHQRVGVGVLGVEIGDDLGVGSILEPVVVVDADPPEPFESLGDRRPPGEAPASPDDSWPRNDWPGRKAGGQDGEPARICRFASISSPRRSGFSA